MKKKISKNKGKTLKCQCASCAAKAAYKLDGIPMCAIHADYYKSDFDKVVKLRK